MTTADRPFPPPHVSRRTFLRGAGVALALPWLDSLPLRAEDTGKMTALAAAAKPPVRFGCIFFSNGVEPEHWWAKGSGAAMEFGPGPKPIAPLAEDIIFIRGLYNQQAYSHRSPHLGRSPNMLSGGWVSTDQNDIRCGRSMDQVLAQQIGHLTPVPSLVVGVEPTEMRLEDGLSMLYGSSISWASATKPATKEIYPSRIFDLLVGDGKARRLDRSVLDEVMSDARSLEGQLGQRDRQKLDEYLESVRDIELRIDRAAQDGRLEGWQPSLAKPDMQRPADELPQNVPEHMKMILDLIVLAFRMDKTRIATCMLNNDLSQMNFGFLPGVKGALHLDLTHNGHDPAREAMYLKTNQFHVEQFAYLVKRCKEIDEGGSTLLDNSLLMFCSNFFDGDLHQCEQLPIILAGHGGGSLQTGGRILDYFNKGNDNRRACSLYLSLMDRMGVHMTEFSDTNKRLADL